MVRRYYFVLDEVMDSDGFSHRIGRKLNSEDGGLFILKEKCVKTTYGIRGLGSGSRDILAIQREDPDDGTFSTDVCGYVQRVISIGDEESIIAESIPWDERWQAEIDLEQAGFKGMFLF